jgi:hypothetical protein
MSLFNKEIARDCKVLLDRALLGQEIACFGVDGFGKHGQTDQAQKYTVTKITIEVDMDVDDNPIALCWIELDGYDASKFGDICTDLNFGISMNVLLKAHEIRADCWEWLEVDCQEETSVVLGLDVSKLLEWF